MDKRHSNKIAQVGVLNTSYNNDVPFSLSVRRRQNTDMTIHGIIHVESIWFIPLGPSNPISRDLV